MIQVSFSDHDLRRLSSIGNFTDAPGITLQTWHGKKAEPLMSGEVHLNYTGEAVFVRGFWKNAGYRSDAGSFWELITDESKPQIQVRIFKLRGFIRSAYVANFLVILVADFNTRVTGSIAKRDLDELLVAIRDYLNGDLKIHESTDEAIASL